MLSDCCKLYQRFLICIIIFLASLYSHAQTADEIISKYVEFIGGEEHWKQVTTLTSSGEYNYGGVAFPFKAYQKSPDRYKFVVTFKGKYYAQAFDGEGGWKIDAFNGETTPTALTGKAARALANECEVELEDVFIHYKNKGHHVSFDGTDTASGKPCYKITLTRKTGETEAYYFDKDTGELLMKRAVAKNPELGRAWLKILYSDYRDVSGIKLPFRTIARTDDQTLLTINVAKAEVNADIADSEFRFNPQTNQ